MDPTVPSLLPWQGASKSLLLGCLLVAVAVRLQCAQSTYLMDQDSPGYLKTAVRINETGLSKAVGSGDPHPFYPLAIALLQRVLGDYELAGLSISISFGSLAVLFIYGAARRITEVVGWASALLYSVHPAFVGVQSEVMTDAASHLFVAVALYGFAIWTSEGRTLGLAILAAGCMLTWTVRLDGLLLTPVLVAITTVLPFVWRPARRLAWGGPILLGLLGLAAIPALTLFFYLWGKGVITPRWPASMNVRTAAAAPGEEGGQAESPKKLSQYVAEYGPVVGPALYLVRIVGIAIFPLNAALVLIGLVQSLRRTRYRSGLTMGSVGLLMLAILATGMVLIQYRMAPRYFAAVVLSLLPLAGVGLIEVSRWAGRLWAPAAPLTVVLLLAINLYPRVSTYRRHDHRGVLDAARWARSEPEAERRLIWVGDPRFDWYCRPCRLFDKWEGEDLVDLCRTGKVYGVAVLECGHIPAQVETLLKIPDLFEEKRVFAGDPGHRVYLHVVRAADRRTASP